MRAILCLFLLAACDDGRKPVPSTPSNALAPSELGLTATVTGNGASVLVDVSISTGTTAVELSPNDALVASASDAPALGLGKYAPGKYTVLLPTHAQTVTFAFMRDGKAIVSNDITLPTPFAIAAPQKPSRASSIALAWEAGKSSEMLALAIGAPCLATRKSTRMPDPIGTGFTLQAADFIPYAGACTLDIELERTDGRTLSGFSSGVAQVVQSRTLELVTEP